GPGKFARPRHGYGVPPSRAALRRQQIVVTVPLVEMRAFRKTNRGAFENVVNRPYHLALRGRVFLEHDPSETVVTRPMVPEHVAQVFSAIVIVKQGRVEATAV